MPTVYVVVDAEDPCGRAAAVTVTTAGRPAARASTEQLTHLARLLAGQVGATLVAGAAPTAEARRIVQVGLLRLDPASYRCWVDGRDAALTAREFDVLEAMATRPGHVFTRADLLRDVWGQTGGPQGRTVDVFMMRLRAKLGPAAGQLRTVRTVGYRLDGPDVSVLHAVPPADDVSA